MSLLINKADPNRSNSSLTEDGLAVTATEVPSGYHEIIGNTRSERENIVVHPDLLTRSGLVRRQNLRLKDPSSGHLAQFTLAHVDSDVGDPTDIWVGPSGWSRLGLTSSDAPVDLEISTTTTRTDLTNTQAQDQGELIEVMEDDGSQTDMMVFAYHGGDIEHTTYSQGQTMKDRINSNGKNASFYGWRGYTDAGDPENAFQKWHITSVDVHPESHTNLNSVKDRGFSYTLSFHGFSRTDEVAIGGTASDTMKNDIQSVIQGATGNEITVNIESSSSVFSGDSPRNLINRAASADNSIQVEQSASARNNYGTQIAQDLADYYINNQLP